MALYELSIDRAHVQEAERLVSLEGRAYPTLVMRWDSRLFDLPWSTTVVLDYTIALPPLMLGQGTFNEVRIAAFVDGAATKFLYFGTEMTANVPRVGPEMENIVGPSRVYQEFRLEEHSCPVPYLKLIQATPRIYGNGSQDYYSPPIKVERYDGVATAEHIADSFPTLVANLDPVKGSILTDPSRGLWSGTRFVGVQAIAILRQGKVVGLHRRIGRTDKDAVPPEVKISDPKHDIIRGGWVAVDIGAASTVVAIRGERGGEFIRIGPAAPVGTPADFESPSEIAFENLARAIKAWRDRVILPMTRWEDVTVGFAAKAARTKAGADAERGTSVITNVPLLRERIERKETYRLRGRADIDTSEALKRPAPPIIDEEGIGAHDPFDPIELYAYYVGLHVNQRARGIYTRYAITMPTGWSPERRTSVLVAFRRGLFRSLPAGMLEYHDLDGLAVVDAGPAAVAFAVQAFRMFGIAPRGENVPFAVLDAGASETGIVFGILRSAKPEERDQNLERVVEYLEPTSIPWLGGERLLHRLAYRVCAANEATLREADIPIEKPYEEPVIPTLDGPLSSTTPEARANTQVLKDFLRPLLEAPAKVAKLPEKVKLCATDGSSREIRLTTDRDALLKAVEEWFTEGVLTFHVALEGALTKIGRDPNPYDGLHVLLGGRLGLHPSLMEQMTNTLPRGVKIHQFKEPDSFNLAAPTVKTACALGVLSIRLDKVAVGLRSEKRDAFRYRVGRNRHGQLADVLDPSVDYDTWREMGACTKPEVEVLFMLAEDDGEVAADDPRVKRAGCAFGANAVGKRLYARAVGPAKVEVSIGPAGGEPEKGAPRWAVDLKAGTAEPAK